MSCKITLVFGCLVLMSASPCHFNAANKEISKYYVYVPGNDGDRKGFYISTIEITNKQYRDFLNDLKAKGDIEKLQRAMVDTAKWNDFGTGKNPFTAFYFQNPAYNAYPVVNVSKEAATLYCDWLTERFNATATQKVYFALPTEEEWIQAAKGGDNFAIYPWRGTSLVYEKKGKFMKDAMCNYRHEQLAPKANNTTNETIDITTPSVSFMPNAYGLYNMSGNVAELLADKDYTKGGSWNSPKEKVTIAEKEEYKGPCPTVGFRPVMIVTGAQ